MEKLNKLFKIAKLIAKEKINSLSVSESEFLENWLTESDNNKAVYDKLKNQENLMLNINELKKFDEFEAYKKVEQIVFKEKGQSKIFKFIPNYLKYAAAVAIFIIGAYLITIYFNKPTTSQYTQATISPGKQRAILITSTNGTVLLDSTEKQQVIREQSAIINHDGFCLKYNKSLNNTTENKIVYNTLITPLGSEYKLILSDSTEIMLNSGSKLIYPVAFNADSRMVVLEGEAFFRVTKSNKSPFIVKANDVNVTVYGTEFNISAYDNESEVEATLVEGSIGVSISNKKVASDMKIRPGQQFVYNKNTGGTKTKEVNPDKYIAWTNGMFIFENEPIENILNILSRWYNFNFEFKKEELKTQRFTLNLKRYDDVIKILDMISTSSKLKFSIKRNSITVYTK